LIDDHASFRQSLAFILEHDPDMTVVGQAGSVAEARSLVEGVEVAVVDLDLPDGNGIEIIPLLRAANPEGEVLLLTASVDQVELARSIESGAAGVIHKSAHVTTIVEAIRKLSRGEHLHSPQEVMQLLRAASRERELFHQGEEKLASLTPRENEVLKLLGEGLSDKEIAERLGVGHETVRTHMVNILGKLGVTSRLQALVFALRHGAVELSSHS
jgi:DNA-binding NarL/FixJ family response regulator